MMAYRQLITPNLNPTISEGGVVLTDWYGWCLAYVQNAFGVGWAGDTAWDAWNNHIAVKHQDSNLPTGVYVPIWFSGYGGQGHGAIYKDGLVYSSPWQHKASYDMMQSIADTAKTYNVTYVGWSEDLAGRSVVESAPAPLPYTLSSITPKQIQLKTDTHRWNVTIFDLPTILARPVSSASKGEIIWVNQECHHIDGLTYYIPEDGNLSGYDTNDCQDYVAPVAAPYLPPAAPATTKMAQTYTLLKTMMYFSTSTDAMATQNGKGTLAEGKYLVYATSGVAYNLTDNNMKNQNKWVNTLDNVIDDTVIVATPTLPVKEVILKPSQVAISGDNDTAWKSTFVPFYPDYRAVQYKTTTRLFILDYCGKRGGVEIEAGRKLNSIGTFTKSGVEFYRIMANNDTGYDWYYGVSQLDDNGQANLLKQEERLTDYLRYIGSDVRDVMDVFFRKIKRK